MNVAMITVVPSFRKPTAMERLFNWVFGLLVALGVGFSHSYLVEVRGRKTGKVYSTPINLLKLNGKLFLVAPRGRTQWVRNAETAGELTLKRGRERRRFRVQPLADAEKAEILKDYLERFRSAVQRYFPVPAGSGESAFAPIASNYPVFELFLYQAAVGQNQEGGSGFRVAPLPTSPGSHKCWIDI